MFKAEGRVDGKTNPGHPGAPFCWSETRARMERQRAISERKWTTLKMPKIMSDSITYSEHWLMAKIQWP